MDIAKLARWVVLAGLFATLLIPLYVSNGLFFPFITGKNFAFRIIVEIISVAWLVGLLFDTKSFKPKISWINFTMLILVVIASLATIFSENSYRSFWSNFERMDGLITLLHLLAYSIVLTSSLISSKIWDWLVHASLAVATVISFYGFAQLGGLAVINQGGVRLDATLGNATYLAVYILFHLFLSIYLLIKHYSLSWTRFVYGGLAIIYTIILYNTATRGAILGTVVGLVVAFAIVAYKSIGKVRKLAIWGLSFIVIIALAFLLIQGSDFVKRSPVLSRFALSEIADINKQPRLIIWQMSLKGALERPILGWGPESYNVVWNKYFDSRLWRQETWFDRSHNVLLDWMVTTGVFGFLAYIGLYVSSVYLLLKAGSKPLPERAVLVGMLVAYFVHNLFVFDNIVSYIIFFLVLAYIHNYTSDDDSGYLAQRINIDSLFAWAKPLASTYSTVTASVLVVLLAFALYFANIKPIQANHLMLEALYSPRAITADKIDILNKLFKMNTFASMETREQLLLFLSEQRNNPNLDRNLLVPLLDLAQAEMEEQLRQSPTDARHQLFLGSFMNTFGRTEEALKRFENARVLSPRKQLIYFNIERALVTLGKYDEAVAVAKQAYELDTTYDRALVEYIMTLVYAGKLPLADSLMMAKYGTTLVNEPSIIQAYAGSGHVDRVIAIWKVRVEAEPSNSQNYLSLAASYYADHQDSKAISTLRKMIEVDPNSKETGEYYIEQISSGKLPRQ